MTHHTPIALFAQRREAVRKRMHAANLAALVVVLDANRYYLSGFELQDPQADESSGRLVIMADGRDLLCTDARFLDAARRLWNEEDIFIYRGDAAGQMNEKLRGIVQGTVGFEARVMTLDFYERLSPGLTMQRADGLIEELRIIKDSFEIERMQAACKLNHALMEWVPGVLVPGRTEAAVAWDIEQFFRNNGAEGLSFSSIVAVGPNAALPHAVPGDTLITENCGVLIDVGCRLHDYCSDQTRSFWVGDAPHPHFTRNLSLIQEAQKRAIAAIRPGIGTAELYRIAHSFLEDNGVAHLFTHGLGHGIGLQTHEKPSLNSKDTTILQAGMIITVEPGVYHAQYGGVRWEHMILVTPEGGLIL